MFFLSYDDVIVDTRLSFYDCCSKTFLLDVNLNDLLNLLLQIVILLPRVVCVCVKGGRLVTPHVQLHERDMACLKRGKVLLLALTIWPLSLKEYNLTMLRPHLYFSTQVYET